MLRIVFRIFCVVVVVAGLVFTGYTISESLTTGVRLSEEGNLKVKIGLGVAVLGVIGFFLGGKSAPPYPKGGLQLPH